jgi:hypothetical protein
MIAIDPKIVLTILMFLLVQRTAAPSKPEPYKDSDAYAVYAAALAQADTSRGRIIVAETATYPRCFPKGQPLAEGEWAEAVQHYLAENKSPRMLQRSFEMKGAYILLPMQDWNGYFLKGDWQSFWKRYGEGSGYIRLSAVGFDRSRTKAMLYTESSAGPRGGHGGYELFTKFGGRWRSTVVNAEMCSWMS